MEQIKVSIIMPSLNVAKYIGETLESVVNQTLKEIEIICIDAGSTDGTEEIIKEYADRDERITFVHSDVKSYGYQVNRGLDMAKGEYVAVMETDDFAVPDMYEYLYNLAKENNTDITKADFDKVTKLPNGHYSNSRVRLITRGTDIYYKVVEPRTVDWLFSEDYFLWKGIYNREFMNSNGIRLNETPGAAFQDMAFMNQVLSYAKRAIYSDRSLYRYRVDREECSTYSPKILSYGVQEFKWLFELIEQGKPIYVKGMYIHMMHSYKGQLYNVLRHEAVNYDYNSPYVTPYNEWYLEHLTEAFDKGIIDIEKDTYGCRIVKMKKTFLGREAQLEDIRVGVGVEQNVIDTTNDIARRAGEDGIVLVGAGIRGAYYLSKFAFAGKVCAFADNQAENYPDGRSGYEVLKPAECISKYPDSIYVISNKNHHEELVEQLIKEGVSQDKIIVNPLSDDNLPLR